MSTPTPQRAAASKFTSGVVLAVVSVIGYVCLALSGDEQLEAARGVFLFSTPFIVLLLGAPVLERIQSSSERTEKQTNGLLTNKIENTATAAAEAAVRKLQEGTR